MKTYLVSFTFYFCITLFSTQAADNVAYLRFDGYQYKLGIINGATGSSCNDFSYLTSYLTNILTDMNGNPIFEQGDFNGDGIADIMVAANESLPGVYVTSINTYSITTNGLELIWRFILVLNAFQYHYEYPGYDGLVTAKTTGDLNSDGIDEVIIIFNDDDGVHQTYTCVTYNGTFTGQEIYGPNPPSRSNNLTNYSTYGTLKHINVGDFNNDGINELNYIFTLGSYQRYKTIDIVSYTKLSNGEPWNNLPTILSNNRNKLLESDVGDFNGDGEQEVIYAYVDPDYTHESYKVEDVISGSIISGPYNLTNLSAMGSLISMHVGDFNGDGKQELTYIFDDIDGYHESYKTIDVINYIKLCPNGPGTYNCNNLSNNSSAWGYVYGVNVGDFNGDGKDELSYMYRTDPYPTKIMVLDVLTYSKSVNNQIVYKRPDENTEIELIVDCGSTIGPNLDLNSNYSDHNFSPIPSSRLPGANSTFYIGWYDTYVENPLNSIELLQNHSTNLAFSYFTESNSIGRYQNGINSIISYININSNPIYPYLKKVLVPANPFFYRDYTSIFESHMNILDPFPNLYGYYVGDDFVSIIYLLGDYGDPNEYNPDFRYDWTDMKNLYNYITNTLQSDKLTFAADIYYDFAYLYDEVSDSMFFDIPMLYNYLYPKNVIYGSNQSQKYMTSIAQIVKKMFNDVRNANQLGYIYIAQAHGEWSYPEGWSPRAAIWQESRYEVFSSIVFGAAGLMYWAYFASEPTVIENFMSITKEITGGVANPPSRTLYQALKNGYVSNFNIICSKDGYDYDQDYEYIGYKSFNNGFPPNPGGSTNHQFTGRNLGDLNYIVRESGGTYYLLTVNNSRNIVQNTLFYLPKNLVEGKPIYEILTDSVGNNYAYSIAANDLRYKGEIRKTFNISHYEPYEVKIFRIGSPPNLGGEEERKNNNNASSQPELEYSLKQNYPNPFNPLTHIDYSIKKKELVILKIFDILGAEVVTLVNEIMEAGSHSVEFNAAKYPSGIYFLYIDAGNFHESKKMILLK